MPLFPGAPLSRNSDMRMELPLSGSIPVDVTDLSILFCNLIRSGLSAIPAEDSGFAGRKCPHL